MSYYAQDQNARKQDEAAETQANNLVKGTLLDTGRRAYQENQAYAQSSFQIAREARDGAAKIQLQQSATGVTGGAYQAMMKEFNDIQYTQRNYLSENLKWKLDQLNADRQSSRYQAQTILNQNIGNAPNAMAAGLGLASNALAITDTYAYRNKKLWYPNQ